MFLGLFFVLLLHSIGLKHGSMFSTCYVQWHNQASAAAGRASDPTGYSGEKDGWLWIGASRTGRKEGKRLHFTIFWNVLTCNRMSDS